MITFEKELDVQELELHRKLCLMEEIDSVMVEIEYDISKYHPATFWHPAEGGEIETYSAKVIDERFIDYQCSIIEWALPDKLIKDAIWTHYDAKTWLDRQMGY